LREWEKIQKVLCCLNELYPPKELDS